MNIKIEQISKNELEIVIQLLKELYLELGEEKESIVYLNLDFLTQIIDSGQTEIYIAKMDNQNIIGLMTLTECQSIYAGGKYGLLDEMYVKPRYRSHKIGAELINEMKIIAKRKSWKRIDVTAPTEERWKKTVSFYKKSGFVFTGPKLKLQL